MKVFPRALVLLAALFLPLWAQAAIHVSISFDGSEDPAGDLLLANTAPIASYLSRTLGEEVRATQSRNATVELARTRTGEVPVLIGPSQVIGSALRNGYEPVAKFPEGERALMVALKSTGITSLDQARGKRLILPAQDALATYLMLGELKDKGIDVKHYFGAVANHRYHESALYALTLGAAELAVASERIARKWLEKNDGVVIHQTAEVPSYGVAVRSDLTGPVREKIRVALLQPKQTSDIGGLLGVRELQVAKKDDYVYVSHLGYFTPTSLAGAVILSAEQVVDLVRQSAQVFDVRSEKEYLDHHLPGAHSLPYEERSKKETGFDSKLDRFDLTVLPRDRDSPIIFYCNGGECWKSYKASVTALKAGFRKVFWFRGGFPEWRQKGLPLQKG